MKKTINFDKKIEFPSMIGEITSISLDHDLKFKDESNIVGNFFVRGKYKRTEASRLEEDFSFDLPTEIILTEKLDLDTTNIEIDDFYYEVDSEDTITCFITILVEGMEIIELTEESEERVEPHFEEPYPLNEHENIHDEIIQLEKEEPIKELRECDGDSTYEEEVSKDQLETVEEVVEEPSQENTPKEEYQEAIEIENIQSKESENQIIMNQNIQEEKTITESEDVGSIFNSLKDSEETFSTYSVYILREEETVETILSKFKISKEELESYNDITNIKIGSKIIIPVKNETN